MLQRIRGLERVPDTRPIKQPNVQPTRLTRQRRRRIVARLAQTRVLCPDLVRGQHLFHNLITGTIQAAAALAGSQSGLGLFALGAAAGLVLLEGLFDALLVLGFFALFLFDLVFELLVLLLGQLTLGGG